MTKRFGGLVAVKDVGFTVKGGEILGPDRTERLRQIDRDEADHGHRAAGCRLGAHQGRRGRRLALASDRAARRRHGVPAFAAAAPPDGAREHHARASARQAAATLPRSRDRGARPRRSPSASALAACARPAALDAALRRSCARWRSPRRSRATRRWCWSTSPSPASRRGRPRPSRELVTEFRDDGRAVLLVDHNVKSVAALVDRVLRHVCRASASPKARRRR